MGAIKVELSGSFGREGATFSAMQHGHADAVARAIEWLSTNALPAAIRLDHELHEQGDKPEGPFGHDPGR